MFWWAELSKTLIRLSADGWGWVPSLLVVWPEATQHWSLSRLFAAVNGVLWEGSRQGVLPRTSAASVLVLMVRQSRPPPAGDPPTLAGRSGSVSYGVTAPSPASQCTHYFVCPARVESLFPPVLLKSCNQIPLAFKV